MELKEFFEENPEAAIAFSGGVDSAYLLYAGKKWGQKVCAYYVKSQFQPEFEYNDAIRLAADVGAEMKIIEKDILANDDVAANPANRCYFCKKEIFSSIMQAAQADGFSVLLDGTNASDEEGDRPGMKALRELQVLSPLRICDLTKSEIRRLSKEAGLFTWNKPSYACLATRIETGQLITSDKLENTQKAENYLFDLGFSDFRVRMRGNGALIQVKAEQMNMVLEKRQQICDELKQYYSDVTIDPKAR